MIPTIKQKLAEAKKDADTNDFSYGKYIVYKECLELAEKDKEEMLLNFMKIINELEYLEEPYFNGLYWEGEYVDKEELKEKIKELLGGDTK